MTATPDAAVTMYTTTWCGYCVRLKKLMQREGIDVRRGRHRARRAGRRPGHAGQRRQPHRAHAACSPTAPP